MINISLVIPVFNESGTVINLINTILQQTYQPAEVVLIDGGSTDNTVQLVKDAIAKNPSIKIIEAGRALPGKGRNIGAKAAQYEWIAFTDAGIKLDSHWLENLVKKANEDPAASIIYGNYFPEVNNFFEKCATISYVEPLQPGKIRSKFIASTLLKKEVWEKTGGFPDWRAAEDLIFMEEVEKARYKSSEAPDAKVYWQLRPNFSSTFKKFKLYSTYNVWAGRQAYWHYGIAKQYGLMLVFLLLGIFHSWYWLLMISAWMVARVAKRIWSHRNEFGKKLIFNPAVFLTVTAITLVIDMATYSGWVKALTRKKAISTFPDS